MAKPAWKVISGRIARHQLLNSVWRDSIVALGSLIPFVFGSQTLAPLYISPLTRVDSGTGNLYEHTVAHRLCTPGTPPFRDRKLFVIIFILLRCGMCVARSARSALLMHPPRRAAGPLLSDVGSFWMNVYLESDEAHAYLKRDDIISVLSQKYKLLHIKHSRPQLKVDGASMGREFEGNVINVNVTPISNTDAGYKWPTRLEFAKVCEGYDEKAGQEDLSREAPKVGCPCEQSERRDAQSGRAESTREKR